MPKIISYLCGGIGNQLFMYAAARRLSLKNDAELVIDNVSGFSSDRKFQREYQLNHFNVKGRMATFRERLKPCSRFRRKFLMLMNKHLLFEKRFYIEQNASDWEPRLLTYKPKRTVYLHGYWQSENYFKDIENIIRSDLSIIPPKDKVNLAVAENIRNKLSIAIHVRFFEPTEKCNGLNAPKDYYTRAIIRMEEVFRNCHFFIFSDNTNTVRNLVDLPDDRITIISNNKGDKNAYADLWLMKQCKHFIIANSTFSWWGAWLGNSSNKIVIAPGFEKREGIGSWGFEGLFPEKWVKL